MINTKLRLLYCQIPFNGQAALGRQIQSEEDRTMQFAITVLTNTASTICMRLGHLPLQQRISQGPQVIREAVENVLTLETTLRAQPTAQDFGVSWETYRPLANRISQSITTHFANNANYQFNPTVDELYQDPSSRQCALQLYIAPLVDAGIAALGMPIIEKHYALSQADIEFAGPWIHRYNTPHLITCLAYALIHTRHPIMKNPSIFPSLNVDQQTPSLLAQWGYSPVEVPEANDVALYLGGFEENIAPTHIAVWKDSKRLWSKFGWAASAIHEHSLFSVPGMYGQHALCLRRHSP